MTNGANDPILSRLADHEQRLREIEAGASPLAAGYFRRFERTEETMQEIAKVAAQQAVLITTVTDDVQEIKADTKVTKNTVRSALITAGASILVQVILFFVLRSGS